MCMGVFVGFHRGCLIIGVSAFWCTRCVAGVVVELFVWRLVELRVLGVVLARTWDSHNFCWSGMRHTLAADKELNLCCGIPTNYHEGRL